MKKTVKKLFMMAVVTIGVMFTSVTAYADTGKTTLAVSSDTVNIGDKVTITGKAKTSGGQTAYATMTLKYDSSVLELESCTATYGGGGGTVSVSVDTFSVTFKAVGSGKTKLSLSATDGVDFNSGEELESVEGSSTSITVKNETSENSNSEASNNNAAGNSASDSNASTGSESNENTADTTKKKSADNSLKTLTISPGTLSPAFKGSTTKYSATVANDVTSIAVSATPVNANATVESVTGNTNLAVGTNQIQIVVKAENGTTATYKIDVTREAQGATVPENTNPSEETPSEEAEPEETESEESTESTEAANTTQQATFSMNENSYVTAALPPEGMTLPSTYAQTEITLPNGVTFTAFQEPVAEDGVAEFYLFYGVNAAGTGSWYRYDATEGTYQRTAGIASGEENDESDMAYLQDNYNSLLEKYKSERGFTRNAIAIMVFVGAVLVIVIINMALYIRRVRLEGEDDDFDDYEEKESSAEAVRRAYQEKKAVEKAKAAERAKDEERARAEERAKAAERARAAGRALRAKEIEEERARNAEREEELARAKAARQAEEAARAKAARQAEEAARVKAAMRMKEEEEQERASFFERKRKMSGFMNDDLDADEDELEDNSFGWKKRSRTAEEDSLEEEKMIGKKKEIKKTSSSERIEVEDFNDF